MWTCTECGRRFANANQWHSCGNEELEEILAGHSPATVATYRAVEAAIGASGPFRVHPQKTRIAFISRMSFASVRLARRWVDLSFIAPHAISHHRVRRIDLYGPTSFGHAVRLTGEADVDELIRGWLAIALERGDQLTLDPAAAVEPLTGRALAITRAPVRATVRTHAEDLALQIPRHVAQAFAAHPALDLRIGRSDLPGELLGQRALICFRAGALEATGLGEGDPIDVTVQAHMRKGTSAR